MEHSGGTGLRELRGNKAHGIYGSHRQDLPEPDGRADGIHALQAAAALRYQYRGQHPGGSAELPPEGFHP